MQVHLGGFIYASMSHLEWAVYPRFAIDGL